MSNQENLELIEMFKRLRVTDVRDGMDMNGWHCHGIKTALCGLLKKSKRWKNREWRK